MLLKGLGISDQDIEKIRVFIPQVPTVAQKTIEAINKALIDFDSRLKALETQQKALSEQQDRDMQLVLSQLHIIKNLQKVYTEEVLNGIRDRQLQPTDNPTGANGNGDSSPSGGTRSGTIAGSASGGRKRGNR